MGQKCSDYENAGTICCDAVPCHHDHDHNHHDHDHDHDHDHNHHHGATCTIRCGAVACEVVSKLQLGKLDSSVHVQRHLSDHDHADDDDGGDDDYVFLLCEEDILMTEEKGPTFKEYVKVW